MGVIMSQSNDSQLGGGMTNQLLDVHDLSVDFASHDGIVHAVDKVSFSTTPLSKFVLRAVRSSTSAQHGVGDA